MFPAMMRKQIYRYINNDRNEDTPPSLFKWKQCTEYRICQPINLMRRCISMYIPTVSVIRLMFILVTLYKRYRDYMVLSPYMDNRRNYFNFTKL